MSGDGIRVEGVGFRIGEFALRIDDLRVRRAEYFVLTGPNGAGKTLLVQLIAGLLRPERGSIWIDGEDVTDQPPWRRPIGYVPQDGLLFPNRDVAGNLAFGLEVHRVSRERRHAEVGRMAEFLGIPHLLSRRTAGLSGGERQRVCLGRALVLQPRVLLLDEPVSAIDESSRDALCAELRRIQRDLNITTLHVAHNRRETEIVADRVGELRNGELREARDNPRRE